MEIITKGINFIQFFVIFIGAGYLIFGFMALLDSYKEQNPAAQLNGFKNVAIGIGYILIAQLLFPLLLNYLPKV